MSMYCWLIRAFCCCVSLCTYVWLEAYYFIAFLVLHVNALCAVVVTVVVDIHMFELINYENAKCVEFLERRTDRCV